MKANSVSPLHIALLLVFAAIFSGCRKDDPEPKPEPKDTARTVLVYQVAKSSLSNNSVDDIDEIQKAFTDRQIADDCRLIVYNSRRYQEPYLLEISASGIDTLKKYGDDMLSTDSRRMAQVIEDMEKYAPAKDYGLIMWGHGSGWMQDGPEDLDVSPLSFGGENNTNWMNITTIKTVLEHKSLFEYIYFDCCFMSSIEVVYELRNCAPVIAGSVTELPGEGMPYHKSLQHLFSYDADAVVNAARTTFEYYRQWELDGTNPEASPSGFSMRYCTMSVVNTDGLEEVASAAKRIFAMTADTAPSWMKPQRFGRHGFSNSFFDFLHYAEELCFNAAGDETYTGASADYAALKAALEKCVTYHDNQGFVYGSYTPINYDCGLSTFIITPEYPATTKNYNTLSWYRDVVSANNL